MKHPAMHSPHAMALPRRQYLLGASAGMVGLTACLWFAPRAVCAQALPWAPAYALALDGRAQWLREFTPAGSPLRQLSARPGAWYALLYLPMAEQWPVQLVWSALPKRHELRLFAMNAPPEAEPTVVHPLPLDAESPRANPAAPALSQRASRFMLPAGTGLDAVFVLAELWSIQGDAPPPLRAQLQSYRLPPRAVAPWWDARSPERQNHNEQGHSQAGNSAPVAPPSPLAAQARLPFVHELPFALPAAASVAAPALVPGTQPMVGGVR